MSGPSAAIERPLLLVVDDDPTLIEVARAFLEADDFAVAEAMDGLQALASFEELQPDLVMLDVNMPECDGLTACRTLRERYPDRPIPILVVTGAEDRESVDRAFDAGATDFISKPINWPILSHRVRYLLRASHNVSDLQQSQASLAHAQHIARIGSWECEGDQMTWSDETFRIFGMDPGSVETSMAKFLMSVHPGDRQLVRTRIDEAEISKTFQLEHRVLLPDGTVRQVQQQGEFVPVVGKKTEKLSATIQDITERRRAEERIQYLANFDSLTGLANRRLFKERLTTAIQAAKEKEHSLALLYMDLDQFKRVNDTLGHSAGDQLLQNVAKTLLDNVRASDVVSRAEHGKSEDAVSRLGGDEFSILLAKIAAPEAASNIARRILAMLPKPMSIDGHEVSTTGSIGISLFPNDGDDVDTLVKHADAAMYHAKERGRNNYQFFNASMNAVLLQKLKLESRLRAAIEGGKLRLHYQPRLDLRTERVVSMEALLRWEDEELGRVPPKQIIPVAEDTGLILPIGSWALEEACAQNKAWQDAGYDPVCVSVNVSSRQFAHQDLRQTVSDALQKSGLDPRHLEIEITESLLLQDDETTATIVRDLRSIGVRVSLDDFGSGYSSLSYLTRFPLDTLKIDRCFVRDVDSDPSAAGITAAVIAMAHSLGIRVVAEGVDSKEQKIFLQRNGCDEAQGFLFSGALPPQEFVRFLRMDLDRQ